MKDENKNSHVSETFNMDQSVSNIRSLYFIILDSLASRINLFSSISACRAFVRYMEYHPMIRYISSIYTLTNVIIEIAFYGKHVPMRVTEFSVSRVGLRTIGNKGLNICFQESFHLVAGGGGGIFSRSMMWLSVMCRVCGTVYLKGLLSWDSG